jgi:II/X family phage/plasmid replication protein
VSVMIDWITAILPLCSSPENDRALNFGYVGSFIPDAAGKLVPEWASPRRVQVKGSFDPSITVRRIQAHGGQGSGLLPGWPALYVSGCPAKFLQGHNVFGSGDLHGLAVQMALRVCEHLGAVPDSQDLQAWREGLFDVHRADCTGSIIMASEAQAIAAIHALDASGHMRFRGRGAFHGTSVIYGGKSRRSSLIFYAKGPELRVKGHKLPEDIRASSLTEYASRLLRSEARCHTMALAAHGLTLAKNWNDDTPAMLLRHHLDALNIAEETMIEATTLDGLPGRLQLAYTAWKQGHDLRATLARNTFYRYRAELLKHGVDIAVKQEARHIEARSTPLRLVVNATFAPVPDWAIGTPLYFEPPALAA